MRREEAGDVDVEIRLTEHQPGGRQHPDVVRSDEDHRLAVVRDRETVVEFELHLGRVVNEGGHFDVPTHPCRCQGFCHVQVTRRRLGEVDNRSIQASVADDGSGGFDGQGVQLPGSIEGTGRRLLAVLLGRVASTDQGGKAQDEHERAKDSFHLLMILCFAGSKGTKMLPTVCSGLIFRKPRRRLSCGRRVLPWRGGRRRRPSPRRAWSRLPR